MATCPCDKMLVQVNKEYWESGVVNPLKTKKPQ